MPVLLTRLKPDDITWPDLFNQALLSLDPTTTGRDDEGLTQRMRVPRGASAWLKGDAGAGGTGWLWRSEQPIDPHSSGKIVVRAFAKRLRADPFDLHVANLPLWFAV